MIKTIVRRHIPRHRAPLVVNYNVEGVNADLAQHGSHQRRFVLAVPVVVRENLGRRVRLKSANAQFDGDVADVVLYEVADRLHLLKLCSFRCNQLGHLLFNLRRGLHPFAYKVGVPLPQHVPVNIRIQAGTPGGEEGNHHLALDSTHGRHERFSSDSLQIADRPLP